MRIGILRDETIVNSLYRTVIPMNALAARGHQVVDGRKDATAFDTARLLTCDVVHIHRHFDRDAQRLAAHLAGLGVAIWWDNDDDITAVPKGMDGYRELGGGHGARVFAGMRKMIAIADLVTTPSEVLAAQYRSVAPTPVRVLENHLPDEALRARRERSDDRIVVGWVAGSEHRFDADQLRLGAQLQELLDASPDVDVVTIGVRLALGSRYRHVRGVQLSELFQAEAQFDIGIAPIADIALNRARSNVKLKEYAAAGVPWLASPVGPYAQLGEAQGGRLVNDGRWRDEIERLAADRRARRKLSKHGSRWAAKETIGHNVAAWEAAMEQAVAAARARTGTGSGAA